MIHADHYWRVISVTMSYKFDKHSFISLASLIAFMSVSNRGPESLLGANKFPHQLYLTSNPIILFAACTLFNYFALSVGRDTY